jgi:hypothetical protein
MGSSGRARLAAASGIFFAVAIAVTGIIGESKDFQFAGDVALRASNEVFGTLTLLTGLAAGALFWFSSTFAARMRQLEGGSGRLAAAVNGSGAILAGLLALSVSIMFAARSGGSTDLAALATGLLDGPALFFPASVFLMASGLAALRGQNMPRYSSWTARLIIGLSLAYLAFAGLQLFKNYAWINETGFITFGIAVLVISIIGIYRWGEMDEGAPAARRVAPAPTIASAASSPAAAPARKPAARKRKPAARKR